MGEGWGEGSCVTEAAVPSPQPSPSGRGSLSSRRLDPQARAQCLDAAAADRDLAAVLVRHDQHVGAAKVRLQLKHVIEVHQEAPMHAQESVGLEATA